MINQNLSKSANAPSTPETQLSQAMKFAQAREGLPDIGIIDPTKRALVVEELKKDKPNLKALLPKICNDIFIVCQDKERLHAIVRDGNSYISIPMNGPQMQLLITDYFFNHSGQYLSEHIVEPYYRTQKYVSAKSAFNVAIVKRAARTANNTVEINLANQGMVVEADSNGYRIKTQLESSSQFRNLSSAYSLFTPVPQGEGDISKIWKYVNVTSPSSQLLLISSMLYSFWGNVGYPFVCFVGQAGSGKSESARFVIKLIDNNPIQLRILSEHDADLLIGCHNAYVIGFDNIEELKTSLSNKLCTVVTGGTFPTRQKFTDTDEVIMYVSNPVFTTSIVLPITKPDLMDRSITLYCHRFEGSNRLPQSELDSAFEQDGPVILGGLFELLSKTLAILPTFRPNQFDRLAEFSRFGQCVALALGLSPESFLEAFEYSQKQMANNIGDNDCLLEPLMQMLSRTQGDTWRGNTSRLLETITPATKPRDWPVSAAAAGKRLIALQPVLKLLGVDYDVVESGGRKVIIKKLPNFDASTFNVLYTTPPPLKQPILTSVTTTVTPLMEPDGE